ncbi:hypothetical protein K438DRAFT_1031965 [Mycena galopus ATCC 62051]|nr:hypothetical protein K438DRAFT_1031965 [Mycena galopus ATCC 62051]
MSLYAECACLHTPCRRRSSRFEVLVPSWTRCTGADPGSGSGVLRGDTGVACACVYLPSGCALFFFFSSENGARFLPPLFFCFSRCFSCCRPRDTCRQERKGGEVARMSPIVTPELVVEMWGDGGPAPRIGDDGGVHAGPSSCEHTCRCVGTLRSAGPLRVFVVFVITSLGFRSFSCVWTEGVAPSFGFGFPRSLLCVVSAESVSVYVR